ncbi:MAG TPA: protein kinase [Kofleriaceae bacterium]|nr:protein kinase [Kofleriaceae bacterium]
MTCPSCNSPLEPNARFCGVCGYRLAPNRRPGSSAAPPIAGGGKPAPAGQGGPGRLAAASDPARPLPSSTPLQTPKQPARPPVKPRGKNSDDVYLGQVLNNRFKVESKIGEGGFGAVYRGVQLATGRKVALKLLHPDMTKDDNLVARFRREGMVLCNLRDAHTITTYDFDQTPSGTLYIAMELLEGKSLHQVFHEEAPLDWKRVFKILTEMCSSLAEAHTQGIVHRDLKPENIYLEARPGNPEFVKILDFGIAKVMRGETIDPQSPQLTATGQTLGTLEYMSPEQLMGKALDGRSDVYALGVLAYEMITGRLPFPDAKGPAGLITAQLKQTPVPPSQACPQAGLPRAADRAILKCLEKDKANRYPDVSALAVALQEVIAGQSSEIAALKQMHTPVGGSRSPSSSADMLETRRGDLPSTMQAPAMPAHPPANAHGPGLAALPGMPPQRQGAQGMQGMQGNSGSGDRSPPLMPLGGQAAQSPVMTPPVGSPVYATPPLSPTPYPLAGGPMPHPMGSYPVRHPPAPVSRGSSKLLWWVIALLAIGAAGGTVAGLLLSK